MKKINRKSGTPLYIQIHDILSDEIRKDTFADGRLPTEHELAEFFGVGRITVSQALAMLEEKKLVCRIKRRGTVVASYLDAFDPQNHVRTVGVVFPETSGWGQTLSHIRTTAEKCGMSVQTYLYPWHDPARQAAAIQKAREKCAGIILYPNAAMSDGKLIGELNDSGYPLVLFDLYYNYLDCNSVSSDHCYGGYAIAREFYRLGFRRPGMVIRQERDPVISEKQRADGFLKFWAEHRKKVRIFRSGKDDLNDYLPRIDALFFTARMPEYDRMRGFPLGHFDSWPKENHTVVKAIQDEKVLAESSVNLLLELLLNPDSPHKKLIVAPQIKHS